ncbi:MAG TPA: hypothetical protein VN671_04730 [Solirubrobacterales bacterium]|nr:hypothetical protein [Solirubrobacterales bacterium]
MSTLDLWIEASIEQRGEALEDLLGLADAVQQGLRPDGTPPLAAKVLTVNQALDRACIPHAFGGAIAGAYFGEPPATIDVDVNLFLPADSWPVVSSPLAELGIETGIDWEALLRDGEVRLPWGNNDIHLFFSVDGLHEAMASATREVPFSGSAIPVVSPEHLLVGKAVLDRPKGWLDIEAILVTTEQLDLDEIVRWVTRLAGVKDPRVRRLRDLSSRLLS